VEELAFCMKQLPARFHATRILWLTELFKMLYIPASFIKRKAYWTLLVSTACLAAGGTMRAEAQIRPSYRINGQLAPQVKPDPMVSQLLGQLRNLKGDIEARKKIVNLEQAIEAALLINPDLAKAYAQIQNSQWNLIAVRRQWYPTLNAISSTIPGQSFRTTTASGQGTSNTTTYANTAASGMTVNLGWTFFDPSRGPAINASSANLRGQQLLFDVSARNLVLSVQETYFLLQEYRQLISSYDEIQSNTDRQVKLAEAQFNSGLLSIADVEQIRTQQYRTLSTLINTYRLMLDSSAQLAQAMALPPGTLVLPADSDPKRQVGSWSEPLPETIAQALRLREEIQASLAQADSASWSASSLFNTYWPKFGLGASGSIANNSITNGSVGLAGNYNTSLNWNGDVGLNFRWQLFDGGINAANAQANQAQANQYLQQAASNRLLVTRQVEQAYSAYLTSQLALLSSKAQGLAARQAVIAVQQRFNVGLTDMATVIQTLNQAIEAATAFTTSARIYNTAVASLYRFSARWPEGTQEPLQKRMSRLKQQ
jgi:outer membrane protein TolC